jgi:serine/threonine-protein kinase RsbW
MAGEYSLDALAVPASLTDLHDLLEQVGLDHPDVSPADLMLVETAVIEIAGNVVEHGQPPGGVRYSFRLQVRPDRLECFLSDSGEPMAPGWDSAVMPASDLEEGRGLALAQAALDELSYARVDGGNVWRMTRYRARA